ncbi:MAG: hypothetical protein M3537_11060 [Chloroflexota bacterium]|nr:hypothetical protein [Chloroflexota bacterium]
MLAVEAAPEVDEASLELEPEPRPARDGDPVLFMATTVEVVLDDGLGEEL